MLQYFPNITGSLTVSGDVIVSGSIATTQGITISGSIDSASYSSNSEKLDNLYSTAFVFTSSFNTYSSSMSTRTTTLENASASLNTASGSFSTRVTRIEGNYATTGSNIFTGAQTVCANITSTGTIIAQTLNVQQVTSSVVYSSGSNVFGNLSTDVQQMTGSVRITGSLNTIGNACITSVCSPAIVGGTVSGTTGTFSSTLYAADTITVCNSSAQLNLLSTNCVLSTINLGNVDTVNTSQISYDHGLNRLKVRSNAIDVLTFTNTGIATFCCQVCVPTLLASGCILINTTSSYAKLTINASPNDAIGTQSAFIAGTKSGYAGVTGLWQNQLFVYDNSATATGVGGAISFGGNAGSTQETWFGVIEGIKENCTLFNYAGALIFRTRADGVAIPAEKMRITSIGNVGIGCSSPTYHLEVRCAASTSCCYLTAMFARSTGANDGVGDIIAFGANGVSSIAGIYRTVGSWGLELQTANQNTRMRIDNSGISCFACQVCLSNQLIVQGGGNSIFAWSNCATTQPGLRALHCNGNDINGVYAKVYAPDIVATVFGQNIGCKAIVASEGACNNGLLLGSLNNAPVYIGSNNQNRLQIEASGIATFTCQVCAPRILTPSQPSATVGRCTGWSGTCTVLWDAVHNNNGGHYNASTGLFTAPVAGYYLVSVMAMTNASDVTLDIELQVNSATNNALVPYQAATGGSYNQVSGMAIVNVSANDTLSFKLNGGSIYGAGNGRHTSAVFRLLG